METSLGRCLDANQALDFASASITAERRADIEAHLDGCEDCRYVVAEIFQSDLVATKAPTEPTKVGRYELLDELGSGSAGTVFRALDPTLQRDVALKLIHCDSDTVRAAFLKEARVLARLTHSNITSIYDAGEEGTELFLAIELIEGGTLRDYQAQHSWGEVLRCYIGAGKGLLAAHLAGVIHRDFKPDNVLVDSDGNAHVTDFGLGQLIAEVEAGEEPQLRPVLVGTPAYMAPEQVRGEAASHHSDQYSFCASLYEGLHGNRMPKAVGAAQDSAAQNTDVPKRIAAIIQRGMHAHPSKRYESMSDLLRELEYKSSKKGIILSIAALAILTAVLAFVLTRATEATVCNSRDAIMSDDDLAALAGKSAAFSEELARRSQAQIRAEIDQCRETAPALSEHCLADQRDALDALAANWQDADAQGLMLLAKMTHELPALQNCEGAQDDIERPSEAASLWARFFEGQRLRHGGNYREAKILVDELALDAEAVGYERIVGRILSLQAKLTFILGARDDALAQFRAANASAERTNNADLRAEALLGIVAIIGQKPGSEDEAERLMPIVEAAVVRSGSKHLGAALRWSMGARALGAQQFEAAKSHFEAARDQAATYLDPGDPYLLQLRWSVARPMTALGAEEDAAKIDEGVRADAAKAMFGDHPILATIDMNLAATYARVGRCAEALPIVRNALVVLEQAFGAVHTAPLGARKTIINCLFQAGKYEDVVNELKSERALQELRNEPESVAYCDADLGEAYKAQQRFEEAEASFQRAISILERELGYNDVRLGRTLNQYASMLVDLDRANEAVAPLERSLEIFTASKVDPITMAPAQFTLARALRINGNSPKRQRELATQALASFQSAGGTYDADRREIKTFLARE